ncbi:MAG: LysM domain-containing protein [Patescibacteria group bacterium]|jgi:LysM repeat protein
MSRLKHYRQHYTHQMKRKYQEDPFAFLVLWAMFFSAIFLIFAFRGLIAVQFMRKVDTDPNAHLKTDELIANTTTDQSSQAQEETSPNSSTFETTTLSGETYTVKDGDTLYVIGQQLGKDWKKIAELNGLEPPYSLDVGQTIKLP